MDRALTSAGFLLGLGVLVRLQYAPFAAVLFVWTILRDPVRWRPLVIGGLGAAALGAISDIHAGARPFAWIFVNVGKNIGEGIAARFGTSPAWQYLADYYAHFGAGALLFAVFGALASGRRYRPLLVAAAVDLTQHSLIAHKEYRFVWISTLVLLVLAAIGSLRLIEHLLERRGKPGLIGWSTVAITAAIWTLLCASSFHQSGGFKAYRGGGALTRLAVMAAQRGDICRLAVVEQYYVYVTPAILPRAVPLSIAPTGVYTRQEPLPPALARSANGLLAERHAPLGSAGYRPVACLPMPEETACLYVRPGACPPDPTYDYQTALERGGM